MASVDDLFVFVSAVLVLLMHVGFSMLEVGCVQPKNRSSILLKNLWCLTVGGISWWALGFLLATGVNMSTQDNPGFLGKNDGSDTTAFLADLAKTSTDYIGWFFGFAFAATAATIVSGAVAERIQFRGFAVLVALITAFVYPVVAYWGWGSNGWLKLAGGSADDANKGYLDFAGSGLVHMVGGAAALVCIVILGPRKHMTMPDNSIQPRFEDNGQVNMPLNDGASLPFCALGTLVLWVGWYGFNCGSQLAVDAVVGIAAVNTTLAPCAAVVAYSIMASLLSSHVDLGGALNATLTGLVAITANANLVESWAAVLIGAVSAPVYVGSSRLLKFFKLDDVIDAIPVHFFGGMWGVLATGLLVSDDLSGDHDAGLFYDGSGLIGWQIAGIVAITAWTGVIMGAAAFALNKVNWLRLTDDEEIKGMDQLMLELSQNTGENALTVPKSPKKSPETDSNNNSGGGAAMVDLTKYPPNTAPGAAKKEGNEDVTTNALAAPAPADQV